MSTEDGLFSIVHDGQIYNAPELRHRLEGKGYHFRSRTDTEVILYSFREWGPDCTNEFNGTWAFAIWDKEKRQLFCSRDRIGVKPFYYYFNGEMFVFASEIKALLEHPGIPRKIDEETVYNYLMWGFESTEYTFFKSIKQLRPAHYILVTGNNLEIRRWWNLKINPDLNGFSEKDAEDAVKHFGVLLEDAVQIRLKSETPPGTTLSGGLDSSAITVLASRAILASNSVNPHPVGNRLKTFSSCYKNESVDERVYIEKVLELTGAEKNFVFPDAADLWEELPKIIWQQGEPAGLPFVFAYWCLMRRVKELGVKVLLDGDGSDAILAGHHPFYGYYLLDLARKGHLLSLSNEAMRASAIIGARNVGYWTGIALARALLARISPPNQLRMRNFLFKLRGRSTNRILSPSFDDVYALSGLHLLSESFVFSKSLNHLLSSTLSRFTCTMKYTDALAAHFQIETRAPFMDYRLIEYVFSLPSNLKIKDGWTKWILRQAMKGILPEDVRLRRDKIGFDAPIRTWLWMHRDKIRQLFSSHNVLSSQFIEPTYIAKNLDMLLNHERTTFEIWRYINLELWLKLFFSNNKY